VIAQNSITQGIYKRRPQSNSTRVDLTQIFAAWSDITKTALQQFFVLAEEVTSIFVPVATRIEQAKLARLPAPEICPNPNGTISFEWETHGLKPILKSEILGTAVL